MYYMVIRVYIYPVTDFEDGLLTWTSEKTCERTDTYRWNIFVILNAKMEVMFAKKTLNPNQPRVEFEEKFMDFP